MGAALSLGPAAPAAPDAPVPLDNCAFRSAVAIKDNLTEWDLTITALIPIVVAHARPIFTLYALDAVGHFFSEIRPTLC